MTVVAISGGMSADSSTHRLTERLLAQAAGAEGDPTGGGLAVRRINVRELAHDLVSMAGTGLASPSLEAAVDAVLAADGVIIAAPVYNAAPLGLVTLFLQLLPQRALDGKAVLLAATGGSARHSLALDAHIRPVIAYLKGLALPTTVFAATEDWGAPESQTGLARRIAEAAAEFRRTLAPAGAREDPERDAAYASLAPTGPRSESLVDRLDPEEVTPFEQLLNG